MKNTVIIKKINSDLELELDVNRIVAISKKTINDEGQEIYYIYFEFAIWKVQGDSYEEVHAAWLKE
jgi:hypothetical protein